MGKLQGRLNVRTSRVKRLTNPANPANPDGKTYGSAHFIGPTWSFDGRFWRPSKPGANPAVLGCDHEEAKGLTMTRLPKPKLWILSRDTRLESGEHHIDGLNLDGNPIRLCNVSEETYYRMHPHMHPFTAETSNAGEGSAPTRKPKRKDAL
jgi:hypothetical protein